MLRTWDTPFLFCETLTCTGMCRRDRRSPVHAGPLVLESSLTSGKAYLPSPPVEPVHPSGSVGHQPDEAESVPRRRSLMALRQPDQEVKDEEEGKNDQGKHRCSSFTAPLSSCALGL